MAGSITEISDGKYRLRVEGPKRRDGKRSYVTKVVRASGIREAEKALARLLVEVGQGRHVGEDATVEELLEAWMAVARLEDSTRRDYRSAIKCHLVPRLGTMKVYQVRPAHLDRMYADLANDGLGPDRIKKIHNVLAKAMQQAVAWEWVSRNPSRDANPPSVPSKPVRAPDVPHVKQVLEAADPELRLWLRLSATLGSRRGEVAALRWSNVDLKTREVVIAEALIDAGGKRKGGKGVVRKETKTRNQRRISLDPDTAEELQAFRTFVVERALSLGVSLAADGYVFSQDAAGITPWRPDMATKQFHDLRESLGLPDEFKMKDLRHFVATQMLAGGDDVRTVAGRLGHARPSTTLDRYAAFIPARDRDAAEKLGRLLG